jgi:hypothetical protein
VPDANHRVAETAVQSNLTPDASENQPTRGDRRNRIARTNLSRKPASCIE